MTNEEVKEVLKDEVLKIEQLLEERPVIDANVQSYRCEAFRKAIELLSNSNEDCIKLFGKIKEEIYCITDKIEVNPDSIFKIKTYVRLSDVIDVIEKHEIELPSIQPKPIEGDEI